MAVCLENKSKMIIVRDVVKPIENISLNVGKVYAKDI
jgi:hypothetical protein